MSTDEITFYDIRSELGPFATNLNCWKTRLSLNYKGLKYKTVFVRFKEIQDTSRAIGAKPSSKYPNGEDKYTLPALRIPSGDVISESLAIAKKLDELYPEKPILQSASAIQAAEKSLKFLWDNVMLPSISLIVDGFEVLVDSESVAYIRNVNAKGVPRSPVVGTVEREEMWAKIRAGWERLAKHLEESEHNLFVDFAIVAQLIFVRHFLNKEEWAANYEKWDNGRWAALLKKYEELTNEDK